eukprot:TRINITY_DN24423_c0_g1_i2.p1 TRINITY_DN24423_c0_g1~~TRINITY_DN24423_c0_g1_i2.p1  ORF type:complete len:517 (+),score=60.84 TRINITY_DN24423_c0_g1_i2:117-1553(+)
MSQPVSASEVVSGLCGLTLGSNHQKSGVDSKVVRDFNQPPPGCDSDAIKLFVGSIPPKYTEDRLRPYFANIGDVIEISVLEGRGSGFVWYKSKVQAERAMRELDGKKPGIEPKEEHRPLEIRQARVKAAEGGNANVVGGSASSAAVSLTPPSLGSFPPLSTLGGTGSGTTLQQQNNLASILATLPQFQQQSFNSYAANMPAIFQFLNYNPTLIVQFIDSLLHQNNQHIQFLTQLKQALMNSSSGASAPGLAAFGSNLGRRSVDIPSVSRMSWDNDFVAKRASLDLPGFTPQPQPTNPNNPEALLNMLLSQQGFNNNLNPQPGAAADLLSSIQLPHQQPPMQDQGLFGGANFRDVLLSQGRQNWQNNQWWNESSGSNNRPSMEAVPENIAATCEGEIDLNFRGSGLEDNSEELMNNQYGSQVPRASLDSIMSGSGARTSFESSNSSLSMQRYTQQFGSPATHLFNMRQPHANTGGNGKN